MKQQHPKVSILMPSLNSGAFLRECWVNKDGNSRDFEIPKVLLRMTIKNELSIFRAQHG